MTKRSILLLLLLSLILAGCGGAQIASPETAALSELEGRVEIKNPDQAGFSAASAKDTLRVQGQVRTGEDGRVRLDLSTGSIVRVAPSSMFTLVSNTNASGSWITRLKLEAGKIWISLRGGMIDVETPSGMASVRGSYLSVWIDPATSDVWVSCLEGWCRAENTQSSLDMIAGQGTILYAWDPAGSEPPPPPMLRYLDQMEINEFWLNNPELSDVMDAIVATASALPPLPDVLPTVVEPSITPQVPTATPGCFTLSAPENNALMPADGPVSFSWTAQPGAGKYILTIITPGGNEITLPTEVNSYEKDMSLLPEGGAYQWWVTAYDAGLQLLCTTEPRTFHKQIPPTPTLTSTPSFTCVNLLTPDDGASLPDIGKVEFTWTAHPDAAKYLVTFIQPSKVPVTFLSRTNSLSRYIESFYAAGDYQWKVTVKDANDQEICTSTINTFSKPISPDVPPPTTQPTNPPPPILTKTPEPTAAGNTPTTFFNGTGPNGSLSTCSPYMFTVEASDPDGLNVVKVEYKIFDGGGNPVSQTYQYLAASGSVWAGNLTISPINPNYQVVWWFWAIDAQGDSTTSDTTSFTYTGTTNCP